MTAGIADRSVLLVEDDNALAESLRYSLEQEGFRVGLSGDGADAIDTVRRDRPLLVMLDLVPPGTTGFDVCPLIRKESNLWGGEPLGDSRTLDVHVMRLRRLIEVDPRTPEHLVTVRGVGYRFLDSTSSAEHTTQAAS